VTRTGCEQNQPQICKSLIFSFLGYEKRLLEQEHHGITYAFIGIMFFIIISGALTLSSAVTLAFTALRAPEAYETEHGLQVIRKIRKQRSTERVAGTLAQAR
jgi:hypothetical protein